MIESLGQVMLYVKDVEGSAKFWQEKVGFEKVEQQGEGAAVHYILSPKEDSSVQLVLHQRDFVAQMSPEVDLATPSLLMASRDLEATYQALLEKGVAANPIMEMGPMKVFHFSDEEGNYFAVQEVGK